MTDEQWDQWRDVSTAVGVVGFTLADSTIISEDGTWNFLLVNVEGQYGESIDLLFHYNDATHLLEMLGEKLAEHSS